MNDHYVLRDPDTGWLWYHLGRAPFGATSVYGIPTSGWETVADSVELTEGARAGWYSTGIEISEARWVIQTRPEILYWRLRDGLPPETRAALAEEITPDRYSEVVHEDDPDDDGSLARLWRAAYVAVHGEPGQREEIVDLTDATVLDGSPSPGLPEGATWVARLPYELGNHREYLHLFPGRLEGLRDAVVDALDAIPGISAHKHRWAVYAKTHGKTRSLDPSPLRAAPLHVEGANLAEALGKWHRTIEEYVEIAERYVRADACARCGGDGIAWEVDYSIEARADRAAKALAKAYKGKRSIAGNARAIARLVLEEVSR